MTEKPKEMDQLLSPVGMAERERVLLEQNLLGRFTLIGLNVVVASLWDLLGKTPSGVSLTMVAPESGRQAEITIRFADGKTAARVIAELRAELDAKDETIRRLTGATPSTD